MSEKRVKIGKDFEHVPAVKAGRGWLGLEKGEAATVCFDKKRKGLYLSIKTGEKYPGSNREKLKRQHFPVEKYEAANEAARNANRIGKQAGAGFGTIRKEEETALKLWREYVMASQMKGTPARSFAEVVREAIERERSKDETPLLSDVIFNFIEAKDATGGISPAYRARIKNRLEAIGRHFKGARIGEVNETQVKDAILRLAQGKDGKPPAPKTQKHWIEAIKELFNWFYTRENATRRASEKLTNPLEILTAPKISKTKEPEILTIDEARAILADIWENDLPLLPAVAVQMFCGVRNAEMLRLRWKDLKDGEFHLSCSITKTKIARAVPVSENLKAWLDAFAVARGSVPAPNELLFPFNDTPARELETLSESARAARIEANYHARSMAYARAILAAEKRTGFKKPKNAFRHTAVSCLAVIHGQNFAADYCGHSIRTQGVNYRGLISKTDAQDYFGIMPPVKDGKAIAFSRSRAKSTAKRASEEQGEREAAQSVPAADSPAESA
ncbi:MAG: tyrosine-type recombinase/integrase [Opitutales bacterium]|nr:tyrosine-type recombinase/integrase [Opitutales bacterium]